MYMYNLKMKLKDTFYGTPTILGWTRKQDARALASVSTGMARMRASNGRHYWYFFMKDINNRDLVRFLMRRNGLVPEFHMSKYYDSDNKQPAFRVHMVDLVKYNDLLQFTNDIKTFYDSEEKNTADVARYVDRIKTGLNAQKRQRTK